MEFPKNFGFGIVAAISLLVLACPKPVPPGDVARCATAIPLEPGVTPPKVSYQKLPKSRRIPGTELFSCLELTVNADGSVSDVAVVEPHDPKFDLAAVEAVTQWRYIPARKNGQQVAVRRRVILYNYRPPTFFR